MITFPNAKINLGLRVLRKRGDGYHDLETIFYPIPYNDILEIVQGKTGFESINSVGKLIEENTVNLQSGFKAHFSSSGNQIPGSIANNLCVKALLLFDERMPIKAHVLMHLHKVIPSGAGLGGGSSDAAFTLKMLNTLNGSPFSNDELLKMASILGSDCAFFILNKPAFATGRGELLQQVDISLKGKYLVLVKPDCNVSTQDAFAEIKPYESGEKITDCISKPLPEWSECLKNDFEATVFKKYPQIGELKNVIKKADAVYCSMSGSGSSVFGIFEEEVGELGFGRGDVVFTSQFE